MHTSEEKTFSTVTTNRGHWIALKSAHCPAVRFTWNLFHASEGIKTEQNSYSCVLKQSYLFCFLLYGINSFTVKDVRVSPALTFEEMSKNSKRYLEASGEWELVDILGETSILQFGIDEWDIITFWVKETED